MLTLALETSTPRGGVALFRDGDLLFSESFTADRSHSSGLFAVIERALRGGARPDQIAVGLGPGSYAGVRIAIAAAIGLSVATGAEMVGIPSIVTLDESEYLAVGDARRGGYWLARVRAGELEEGPAILSREELERRVTTAEIPVYTSESLNLARAELRFPEINRLALLAAESRSIHSRGALEPIYLRDPHITQSSKRTG